MIERRSIPAWYKGTLYRSHLEARWAIFLDELDVKFNYEPQGFDLGGTAYLPDFATYGALGTVWAEVKPTWEADLDGVAKWRLFVPHRPSPASSRAALLVGEPSVDSEHIVIGGDDTQDNPLRGPWEDDCHVWLPCPAGYHFDLAYPGKYRTRFAEDGCEPCAGGDGPERLDAAVRAALSHRFGRFGPPPGKAALGASRGDLRPALGQLLVQPEGAGAEAVRQGGAGDP